MNDLDLNIKKVECSKLNEYENNTRTHSLEQIDQIATSINTFGFVNPILIDEDNLIIAGHGRLMAAKKMGIEAVPVIQINHLTTLEKHALSIADNKISDNAGWDEELLKIELEELNPEFDLESFGFKIDELDLLLANNTEEELEELDQAIPEKTPDSVSQLGDIWTLGNHRVMYGDATNTSDVRLLMEGKKANMVFTDPPYNVDYGHASKNDEIIGKPILNDALGKDFEVFLTNAIANLIDVCEGAIYICCPVMGIDTFKRIFESCGGHISTFLIWVKNHFVIGRADYQRRYEPILYGWVKDGKHHWCGDRNQTDVWELDRPSSNKYHPTMKPLQLVVKAIENSSKPADIVLDLFGGSGTTLIACEKKKRTAYIMELDPQYVDIMTKRWQDMTGLDAVNMKNGLTFNGVEQCQEKKN